MTVAPEGYILPAEDITFKIIDNKDGTISVNIESGGDVADVVDNTIKVEFEKTKVQIQAVDANGQALEGTKLQILDSGNQVVEEWDTTAEAHTIEGLKIGGTYTLKVTVAPEGYILPADITFSIDGSGNISGENVTTGDDGSILVKFEKTKVQIQAVDAEETALAGAHIQILDSESQVVEEWDTTAEAHTVEGLKTEETYILTVTTAPDGYILPADITFSIDEYGTVSRGNDIGVNYDENGNEVLLVKLKKIEIKTVELVSGENQLLSGVGLKILDNEGIVVGENSWSSADSNPYIPKGLKTNVTYTLKIDSVPNNWYITPEDTNFTIDKYGKIEISNLGNIYVENNTITVQLEKNELQIHVVDETNNKPLVDTKVQILDPDGKVISEWTSNELSFVATNLQFDKVYTVHIVKPSNGYKKPEHDSTFKINNDKSIEIISGANLSTSLNTTGHIRLLDIKLEKDEVSVPNNSNNNSGNKWNIENFESKEINGIKHYFDGGRTYVKIPETPGIVWLKEESDGTSAWYGLDNSSSTFEPNSIFYVEWHSPGSSKYEDLYSQLDKNIKSQIEDDNGWIFQTGVLTQTGDKITEIKNLPVNLYVQIGDDWDLKDLKSVYIQSQSDENTAVTYVENLKDPEGTDNFGIMKLKHFSPYFIYDTEDDIITDNNTTESTNKNNSINNSIATGDETTKTIILVSILIIITSGVIIFWALKRKK